MRVTGPLIKVLNALLAANGGDIYGLEILRSTGLKSGTLYPLLDRLEQDHWVESHWEDEANSTSGGPRRRFYRLKGHAINDARQLLFEYGLGGTWQPA